MSRPLSKEALKSNIDFLRSTIANMEYRLVNQEQELEDLYHRLEDCETQYHTMLSKEN